MTEFSEYYKRELRVLRERAAEFGESHPSIAGLLSGGSSDPDVERILEGVAFLTANIRRTADGGLDELGHDLAQVVCPHHLQPIPSATVVAFKPKNGLKQTQVVSAGTQLESIPVDGEPCYFRTTIDTPVAPLQVQAADRPDLESEGEAPDGQIRIRLRLSSGDTALNTLQLPSLRLHIAGEWSEAADLYMLLTRHLQAIRLTEPSGGRVVELPPSALTPMGFGHDESLLPRPGNVMPVFGMLQDYFLFPEKFLFLELDLGRWDERGTGSAFEIVLLCDQPELSVPSIHRDRFVLHAAPAINAFTRDSEPVVLDQRQSEYALRPAGGATHSLTVHSVERVEGIARGGAGRRDYLPFSAFLAGQDKTPVYQVHYRRGEADDSWGVRVSTALPSAQELRHREVLKASLICTNGDRAEALLPGDIQTPTQSTPELVTFTNLTAPTPARRPPLDRDELWHLISHLSLNFLSLADVDSLKSLLRHYAVPGDEERSRDTPNLKRIESIRDVIVRPDERLLGDCFVRGQSIVVRVRNDHFSGVGDRYLFGAVLNRFFAELSALNTYTVMQMEESVSGERIEWPPMLGTRPLM